MKRRLRRQRLPAVPGEEWARRAYVEAIAEEMADGWRATVFGFLFDPSPIVRDVAAEWLCLESEIRRSEHEIALADSDWEVRYHAPSGRLADPILISVPSWVSDLFADALARERNAIVARQIMLLLALRAPERFPRELSSRIHEDHGYARAGFGLGLVRIGETRGWDVLRAMLDEDEFVRGTMFVLGVLTSEEWANVRGEPNERARAYVEASTAWLAMDTEYPYSKAGGETYVERMRAWTARS